MGAVKYVYLADNIRNLNQHNTNDPSSDPEGGRFDPFNWQFFATCTQPMDDFVHHCLRELAFDGDLGEFFYVILEYGERAGSNLLMGVVSCRLIALLRPLV